MNIILASSLGEFKQKIKDRKCKTWICLLYHSYKKRKNSVETWAAFSWINFPENGKRKWKIPSWRWFKRSYNYNWLIDMLDNDNLMLEGPQRWRSKFRLSLQMKVRCRYRCSLYSLHIATACSVVEQVGCYKTHPA